MNKAELIDAITETVGDKRTATAAVEAVLATVQRAVADGEKVSVPGFGVFEKVDRAARAARNPATGEAVQLEATSVPRFRAGQKFKDVVRGAAEPPELPSAAAPQPARATSRAAAAGTAVVPDDVPGAEEEGAGDQGATAGSAAAAPGAAAVPSAAPKAEQTEAEPKAKDTKATKDRQGKDSKAKDSKAKSGGKDAKAKETKAKETKGKDAKGKAKSGKK